MSLKHGLLGLISLGNYTGYELDEEFKETMKYIWQAKKARFIMNWAEWSKRAGLLASAYARRKAI